MNDTMGNVPASSEIAQRSGTSFRYAFFFLSAERRAALDAVYAYCRLIDDIVDGDDPVGVKAENLRAWRDVLPQVFDQGSGPAPAFDLHPVARELQRAQRQFGLRYDDALAVLIGCERDLHKRRYAAWDEVYDYCYHVASSVGLLCIELFGCTDPRSRDYAIHLGRALQLTNILRDIAEDAGRDRLYLPLEALSQFGLEEADVLSPRPLPQEKQPAAQKLLASVARRAREEYRLAREAKSPRDRRALVPAEIMAQVYSAVLADCERRGLELLHPKSRVKLSTARKATAALSAVLRSLF